MHRDSSLPGENTLADTAASKSESFYKLTGSDAKELYKLGVFDANAYVLMIIRSHGAAGWKWTFSVKDFCEDWEIPQRTFYRAISKLKSLNLLHWEAKDAISVWYEPVPEVAVPMPEVAVLVPQVAVPMPLVAVPMPLVAKKIPETLTSPSVAKPSDYYQSYSEFFKISLSDSEREIFLNFGRKKASQLPKPPELPDKWIAANWEDLYRQFQVSDAGRKAKLEATTTRYDWENDPRLMNWLQQSYEGGFLWTQEVEAEREERSAFYSWAQQTNAYEGRVE